MKKKLAFAALLALGATSALAMDMSGSNFTSIMHMMHMHTPAETGDTDHDFIAMMVPHHQAAVDMAKLELQKGKDPFARDLAQRIIDGQSREIGQMNDWLSQHK